MYQTSMEIHITILPFFFYKKCKALIKKKITLINEKINIL